MTVESVTVISDLNASYPAAGDIKSEGDDHIRNLKTGIKTTFPNISGAVTPTHTELNYVDGVTSAIQTQIDAKAPTASPTFTGTLTAAALTATGAVTLGDASGDTVTINAATVACANGLNFDSNTLVIDATNNRVGFGVAPSVRAHVKSSSGMLRIETTVARGGGDGFIDFYDPTGQKGYVGYGDASDNYYVWNRLNSVLLFGANDLERMRIDASGNVGIGGASSGEKLEVVGNIASTGGGTARRTATFVNTGAQLYVGVESSSGGSVFTGTGAYSGVLGTNGATSLGFATTGIERMRIDTSGNTIPTLTATPPTLSANLQLVMNLTSNTNLRFSVRGSDGTTRVANLTLA